MFSNNSHFMLFRVNNRKILQFIVNNRKKVSNSNTDISFGTTQTYSVYPQTDKQTKPKLIKNERSKPTT